MDIDHFAFPTADFGELTRQAPAAAANYMRAAKSAIDDTFGDGYATRHPELVAQFMRTAAQDFHTAMLGKYIDEASSRIQEALREGRA